MSRWLSKLWRKPTRSASGQLDPSAYTVHPPNLTFLTDVSLARWVEAGFSSDFASVGALVPGGYEAYSRVLNPARTAANRPLRWSAVVEWSGQVYHPLMSFEGISAPADGHGSGIRPWEDDPEHGRLDEGVAWKLAAFLLRFTETSHLCYFGVWDGYGQYSGGTAMLAADGRVRRLGTPRDIRRAERVKGVGRDYLLYEGRPEDILGFYHHFLSEPPNIWWPADHAWFVATDIDLDSTYVGASRECIAALLEHPVLEAVPADREASVAMTADTINLGGQS